MPRCIAELGGMHLVWAVKGHLCMQMTQEWLRAEAEKCLEEGQGSWCWPGEKGEHIL